MNFHFHFSVLFKNCFSLFSIMTACKGVNLLPSFVSCNTILSTHIILISVNRHIAQHESQSFLSRKPSLLAKSRLVKVSVRKMSGPVLEASAGFDSAPRVESKLFSAAAARNTQPIIEVLAPLLAPCPPGPVISVAEGSGQHVSSFAGAFPQFTFQPTEIDASALESISEYRR
jgi:hypothetical protein